VLSQPLLERLPDDRRLRYSPASRSSRQLGVEPLRNLAGYHRHAHMVIRLAAYRNTRLLFVEDASVCAEATEARPVMVELIL
jgi:hypothetical protein